MSKYKELREQVYEANMELPKNGLVLYAFGNVSGLDRSNGIVAIKPSGVPYCDLTPDKIVLVDMDNNIVDSKYNPSSDTKTHIVLYKEFEGIGGIVHTHSTYATAWAQAQRPIPCFGTTHADYVYGDIPCTNIITDKQIEADYETETGSQITGIFKDIPYSKVQMVLVAAHGPFTWGKNPDVAVHNSVILEELAKTALLSYVINPEINPVKQSLLDKHFLRKHGNNAYYGQQND